VNVPLKLLSLEAYFSPKCTKHRLAAGLCRDPLGELTVFPQTLWLDLRSLLLSRGEETGGRDVGVRSGEGRRDCVIGFRGDGRHCSQLASGTACHSMSSLHHFFLSSALICRRMFLVLVTRNQGWA